MSHSPEFLKIVTEAKAKIKETCAKEVRDRMANGEQLNLIDCREESEWEKGHIQGATYLGKGVVERDIEDLYEAKNTALIFYCGGGFRSALVCENLQRMGYTNAISMVGGFRSWQDNEYPIDK